MLEPEAELDTTSGDMGALLPFTEPCAKPEGKLALSVLPGGVTMFSAMALLELFISLVFIIVADIPEVINVKKDVVDGKEELV